MVIGYDPVPCRTNEARGGLEVVVTVLSGSLAREVAVQFETFSGSATGTHTIHHSVVNSYVHTIIQI